MTTIRYSSIEDIILTEGVVTYKVKGKSMEPMIIDNRDLVTIRRKKVSDHFVENDIVLYRQKGNLTLHRIVEVLSNGEYVMLGDNCSRKEYGIHDDDIIGILTSFKHNGTHYELTDAIYLSYVQELREKEHIRTRRKLIYDIIVNHLGFLPANVYAKIKNILKKLILYKTNVL